MCTIIKMCENEATRCNQHGPFQQYLADTFPEDGKRSTSGVAHELDSTVKLRLLKDHHGAW